MLLRLLLGLSVDPIRNDIPPRPENWSGICGWYGPAPGPVTNVFSRALMGPEVVVQDGHLMLKTLSPIPSMRRGFRLYPDDPDDPRVFRIYFPEFGMNFRVVFDGGPTYRSATQLLMDVMSFEKRPDSRNPRPWATGGLAAALRSWPSAAQCIIAVPAHPIGIRGQAESAAPAPCGALRARPVCRVTEPVLEDSKSR